MKFLFHFYDLHQRAGIQRAICELANALVMRGDEAMIVTNSARSDAAYRLDERVVLTQILHPEWQSSGIAAWPAKVLWALRQMFELHKVVTTYRPSIVVDHGTALGLVYPFGSLGGAPFVMQRHFPGRNFPRGGLLYRLLSKVCGGKTLVVLTETIANDMRSLGYRRVIVISNIIPAEARPVPYREVTPRTGLLMGRAKNPQKGFDLFLETLAITKMEGWQFTIVGPGVDSDPLLLRLVREHHLETQVSLLQATSAPYELLRRASCVIMPSRYEALPMLALEALSVGRPVIASDADGLREVVIHGVNGLTFPSEDLQKFSECLAGIRDDQALLERLAIHAGKGIEHFDSDSIVNQWRDLATRLQDQLSASPVGAALEAR